MVIEGQVSGVRRARTETKFTFWEAFFIFPMTVTMLGLVGEGLFIVVLPFTLLTAWVRSKLWEWFVIPYFHLPRLGVWEMLALGMLVGAFRGIDSDSKEKDKKTAVLDSIKQVAIYSVLQLLSLGIGFLIHHFGRA